MTINELELLRRAAKPEGISRDVAKEFYHVAMSNMIRAEYLQLSPYDTLHTTQKGEVYLYAGIQVLEAVKEPVATWRCPD